MTDWIIAKLLEWSPEDRRRAAVQLLIGSTVGMIINVGLFLASIITVDHLILITLVLSWGALQITALDIICSTDVRVEVEG